MSSMTPELWQRAKEIFADVQDLDPEDRERFLNQACRGDEALRHELVSLLGYEEPGTGILDGGPLQIQSLSNIAGTDAKSTAALSEGQRVGPYRIERVLGQGGMGTVAEAVREDDFNQRVALKLVRRGQLSAELLGRFHIERQILADLRHPNIAAILDGGTTDDGVPYFAMEYIEGERIDCYCETHGLSIRERLELFQQVCTAVQLAHQNLVVHRDLKPDNILVTADGVPKLLDFGIAKLLGTDLNAQSLATVTGRSPMTPKYASPEQFEGQPITTATDTYSLGVVLYELLAGKYPYPLSNPSSISELERAICEVEPQKPSTAVRYHLETRADATTVAPQTSEPRLSNHQGQELPTTSWRQRRRLAGDLDCIVLKALRKEPLKRYSSAEQLSEDIGRHLAGLPVTAREGTFVYRTGKYLKRNRQWLSAAMVVLLVVSAAVWQVASAGFSKRLAEARVEEAESQATMRSDLLTNLFVASDLERGETFSIRQLLARGQTRIQGNLDGESLATQLETLGLLFQDLELRKESRELLEEALHLRRRLYADDHPLLARVLNNLAAWHYHVGDLDRAETLYVEALAMRKRLGQEGIYLAKTMSNLASILMGRGEYARAEELYRRVLALGKKYYGPKDTFVASSLRSLGVLYYFKGDFHSAEPLLEEALEIRLELFGPDSTQVANARSSLGRVLQAQGKLDAADDCYVKVLQIREKLLGEEHPHVALVKKDQAALYFDQGNLKDAEVLLAEALSTLRDSKPEGSWEIADAESLLGACLTARGRFDEAERLLNRSYRILKKERGEHAIHTRAAHDRLEDFYRISGKPFPGVE